MNKKKTQKIETGVLIAIMILVTIASVIIEADPGNPDEYESVAEWEKKLFISGEFLVKFKQDTIIKLTKSLDGWIRTGLTSIDLRNEKYQVISFEKVFTHYEKTAEPNSHLYNIYKLKVPLDSNILDIVHGYISDPNIEYVEPNYIYSTYVTPNDPKFDLQWALNQSGDCDIDAPEAWDIETGDANVTIAIVDSGVDYYHEDLADNIWINEDDIPNNNVDDDENGYVDDVRGWNFCNDSEYPLDDNGHGTHCSGIATAVTNNAIGIAGVCWNCLIMPVKALDAKGYGSADDLANAVSYATDNGADVISMSWGGYIRSNLICDALDDAHSKGAVLVAAAGNDDDYMKTYPASYEVVVAVAATNKNDTCVIG